MPHPDFFSYCRELLERYRSDARIWCISGSNFQDGVLRGDASYYFSRYNHCWGWASWRRCWSRYSEHGRIWEQIRASRSFQKTMFEDPVERQYWMNIWEKLFVFGTPDSWAYRWSLVCMANGGLTALPGRNLVTNVGFNDDATHTHNVGFVSLKSEGIGEALSHPRLVIRDSEADEYTFRFHYGGLRYKRSLSFWWRLVRRLELLLTKPLHYPRKLVHYFAK